MRKTVIFLALLLPQVATAQEPVAYSLESLYEIALKKDNTFQANRYGAKANAQGVHEARAALLPQVNASYTRTYHRDVNNNVFVPAEDVVVQNERGDDDNDVTYAESTTVDITLDQSIYRHSDWVQYSQAKTERAQAKLDIQAAKVDLAIRLATEYFGILSARADVDFARATQKAFLEQLERSKVQFEVGLSDKTELLEATARYNQSEADLIVAENALNDRSLALKTIIGFIPLKLAPLSDKAPLPTLEPASLDYWLEIAGQNNLDLKIAQKDSEIADLEVDKQWAAHLPDLGMRVSWQSLESDQFNTERDTEFGSLSLRVNVPLFSGGLTHAQTKRAHYNHRQADRLLDLQKTLAADNTTRSYLNLRAAIKQAQALKKTYESAIAALEATQTGYDLGSRNIIDVLDATQLLFAAQRDALQARHSAILNWLTLQQSVGMLALSDLKMVDSLLDKS